MYESMLHNMCVFQVKGVDVSLEVINNRQTVITDKLIGENEKFQKVSEEYKISDMIQKTKQYQQKLSGLQKEMVTLSERSANMKTRAMRLQEAKQKEALRREQKRQQAAEREEALVGKFLQNKYSSISQIDRTLPQIHPTSKRFLLQR